MCTCRGLTREHNRGRAVVNRVCNVGNLGSRRTGIVYHRFEHFGCRNYSLSEKAALLYEVFLYRRNFYKGNLNTEVSSCDHYSVGNLADVVDIVNACAVFYLGDKVDALTAVCVKEISDSSDVRFAGYEGCGNEINVVLYSKE